MNSEELKLKYEDSIKEYNAGVAKINYAKTYVDRIKAAGGPFDNEYFSQARILGAIDIEDLKKKAETHYRLYMIIQETEAREIKEATELVNQNRDKMFKYL